MRNSTENSRAVKPEGVVSDPKQKFLGKEFALLDRYELQAALVDTLEKTENHRHLVTTVSNCHRTFRAWACRQNHRFALAEKSCSLRVCPHCCRRRSLILGGRMEAFLMGKSKDSLRYAVLSERNCHDLEEGNRLLWESWTRLRRSVRWGRKVKGCIVAMEVTYNPHCVCGLRKSEHSSINGRACNCSFQKRDHQPDPWHPHLNVLMEGEYFPQDELRQAWLEATDERGQMVWIKAADAGTVRELIKYITKISDLIGDPIALDEFLTVLYKKRMIRTYGTFYRLKLDEEEAPRLQQCPDCGSTDLVKLCIVKPQEVSLDLKGVLRVNRSPRDDLREIAEAVKFDPSAPKQKKINFMPKLKKRWEKAGYSFAQMHEDLARAADRLGILNVDTIQGWGYSEWIASLRPADPLADSVLPDVPIFLGGIAIGKAETQKSFEGMA